MHDKYDQDRVVQHYTHLEYASFSQTETWGKRIARWEPRKATRTLSRTTIFLKRKKENSFRVWESGMYIIWIAIPWGVKEQNCRVKNPCCMVNQTKAVTWFKGEHCYSKASKQEKDVTSAFCFSIAIWWCVCPRSVHFKTSHNGGRTNTGYTRVHAIRNTFRRDSPLSLCISSLGDGESNEEDTKSGLGSYYEWFLMQCVGRDRERLFLVFVKKTGGLLILNWSPERKLFIIVIIEQSTSTIVRLDQNYRIRTVAMTSECRTGSSFSS